MIEDESGFSSGVGLQKYFVKIPEKAFWSQLDIDRVCHKYNAKYMGYWCTKDQRGGWNDSPVDVFYVADPDRSKGHSNYFGMFTRWNELFICNAESAFSETMDGIVNKDGEVIISRYRHDYRAGDICDIDGGRDYTKLTGDIKNVERVFVTVDGPNFIINGV